MSEREAESGMARRPARCAAVADDGGRLIGSRPTSELRGIRIEPPVAATRPPRGRARSRLARFVLVGAALACGGAPSTDAQFVAVFVDGRILPVKSARLLDEGQIRLELGEGGRIDVPIGRFDRIIEDDVEVEAVPIPEPPCDPAFVDQPLPAGIRYAQEIAASARQSNLHPRLLAAVVDAESRSNRWAVSRVGARGLMQLMPAVWMEQGVADPHDPAANLRAGSRHLAGLVERFGDLSLALAAYNAGAATVERAGGMPPYRETREYVRRVLTEFCPATSVPDFRPSLR